MATDKLEEFEQLLNQYNQCFYERDIESLRNMYVPDGNVIYFDNHANSDSSGIEAHLIKVKEFFEHGSIVQLLSENLAVCQFPFSDSRVPLLRKPQQRPLNIVNDLYKAKKT